MNFLLMLDQIAISHESISFRCMEYLDQKVMLNAFRIYQGMMYIPFKIYIRDDDADNLLGTRIK